MTEMKAQICQACRKRPATTKKLTKDNRLQWRCQTCVDLKNKSGFGTKE